MARGEDGGEGVEEEGGRRESVKSSSRWRRGVGAGLINRRQQISDSGAHGRWCASPQ